MSNLLESGKFTLNLMMCAVMLGEQEILSVQSFTSWRDQTKVLCDLSESFE